MQRDKSTLCPAPARWRCRRCGGTGPRAGRHSPAAKQAIAAKRQGIRAPCMVATEGPRAADLSALDARRVPRRAGWGRRLVDLQISAAGIAVICHRGSMAQPIGARPEGGPLRLDHRPNSRRGSWCGRRPGSGLCPIWPWPSTGASVRKGKSGPASFGSFRVREQARRPAPLRAAAAAAPRPPPGMPPMLIEGRRRDAALRGRRQHDCAAQINGPRPTGALGASSRPMSTAPAAAACLIPAGFFNAKMPVTRHAFVSCK